MKGIRVVLLFVMCLILTLASQVRAQVEKISTLSVEFGDISELVGKRRVFVLTEAFGSREKVLKELKKSPYVEVVGRKEEADFYLIFGANLAQDDTSRLNSLVGTSESTVASGEMVAQILVETGDGTRTRVLWFTEKRQAFISTGQFFQAPQFNSSWRSLVGSLIGQLVSRHPKFAQIPIGRAAEVNATRDFVKALKKAYERRGELSQIPPISSLRDPVPSLPRLGTTWRNFESETVEPQFLSVESWRLPTSEPGLRNPTLVQMPGQTLNQFPASRPRRVLPKTSGSSERRRSY